MKIYIGHSREYDYETELYKIIRADKELNSKNIILPHEEGYVGNITREFYSDIDIFIAEVSYKATGLGIELGWAYDDKIPIYCIYKKGTKISSSLKIVTDKFYEYDTNEELINVIKAILEENDKI